MVTPTGRAALLWVRRQHFGPGVRAVARLRCFDRAARPPHPSSGGNRHAIVSHERVESALSPLLAALFLVLPSTTARRWIKIRFSCAHAVEVAREREQSRRQQSPPRCAAELILRERGGVNTGYPQALTYRVTVSLTRERYHAKTESRRVPLNSSGLLTLRP